MRTTKKRTTNKRPDPVFSEKQQKAAVPLGMAAFLVVEKALLVSLAQHTATRAQLYFVTFGQNMTENSVAFPIVGGGKLC